MVPLLYFIRHGETDWNAQARFQGQQDIPLNDKGRAQAARNGAVLRDLIARDIAEGGAEGGAEGAFDFVASPLGRTRETMEIIRAAMGLDPMAYRTDERLRELSFGEWEGRTVYDLEVAEAALWRERQANKWYFQPKGGESYHLLTERVKGWADELTRPTVVVAHGGVNRAVHAIFTDIDRNALAASEIPQDKIMVLDQAGPRWV